MSEKWHRTTRIILAAAAASSWLPSAIADEIGRCFSGGCDVAWALNRRFDDGLRSKSEALVGPFRDAYFQIANDLFDAKLRPMINDIDQRAQARIKDIHGVVDDAGKIIDASLAAAESVATKTPGASGRNY